MHQQIASSSDDSTIEGSSCTNGADAGAQAREDTGAAARARRKRMDRRRFERRFKRGVSLVAGLYVAAMIVAPERTTLAPAKPVRLATTLPSPLAWRPVFDVVNRKKSDAKLAALHKSAKPLSVDTVQNVPRTTLTRWHRIYKFANQYKITVELSGKVYDAALKQGLEPELAFRVVQLESEFKNRALSSAGAIGLTQLMLSTARGFEPNVTRQDLTDPDVNLRIGFKYLRALIRENNGDLKLALLVYNRGPVAVQAAIAMGLSPSNGYEHQITKGYRGRGVIEGLP
jgi:soluble lytic murein transglycosylase-like protein